MRSCKSLSVVVMLTGGLLVGCTQAGPFVTNVSSSGTNKLSVDKCQVHFNWFMGTISKDDCTSHEVTLQVQPTGGK